VVLHVNRVAERGRDILGADGGLGRPGRDDPAVGQQQRVGGGGGQLLQVVRHQHRRDVRVRHREQVDGLEQLLARGDVQPGRRLVEQQQPRLADQRPGDQRAPALALGQDRPPQAGLAVKAERSDERLGPVGLLRRRLPPQRGLDRAGEPGQHHVAHGQRRAERVARVHVADHPAQRLQLDPAELRAEHVHGARGGEGDRPAEAEDGALARAVGAEHRPVLAAVHREGDAADDLPPVPAVRHVP
jgi:hypothetical protein